ncbi:NAD-dependent succinate-semialdehyde dehydrogenase [Amycolatopsis saalfeldensis]|uniref:Succinate-semialdehyde dehydrogenase / glutarate-semialdehyde dehydrogenase n=1 Tax=Amycolatopsis saalfeldensis TaxID=394193 RepID=A0A1H8YG01_9PSEU|nr:NAD-dependent succinate-semialdehyde dehydrogenase [Amycolatopsis saalfeldensis]SEP51140.1 succinate-semialdehyde dehydrogenase / glutarate-semialdehyde dehydrogenase [Amycolatopsis saalfeldensis]
MQGKTVRLYVGGEWVETGATFTVEDPATGERIAEVADAGPEHALAALDAAHASRAELAASSPRTRAGWLRAAFDAVLARTEEFAETITREMGKPLAQSRGEVAYGAEFLRWFAEQAAHLHGGFAVSPDGASRIVTTHRPVGPALLITPWNFPLAMLTRKLGAALAAGCPVLLKPAEQTPLTAALLTEILDGLGLPEGAVSLLTTTRAPELSAALMADDRLRKVSFTGSTAVGSALIRQSAHHVQRTSMELGGNAPFLVFDDAGLEAALDGAMLAKFRNGGESCVAANRFLVHRAVAEEFTARFTERVRELKPGNGFDPASTLGPLIDARQRDKVTELVRDAVAHGAKAVTGGEPIDGPGYFFEPTVLTGVDPAHRVMQEEIFGPVAPIAVFDTEAEAVELANATPYGLVAFVYTRDLSRAVRVAEACETGMVGINRGIVSEPAAPFGGVKASGLGREGGRSGIEEYLETGYFALGL